VSVETAELTVPAGLLPEPVAAEPEWLDGAAEWYIVTPPEPLGDPAAPKFSYDRATDEYAVNWFHPQASALARIVLQGAVDHDKVLYSELDGLVYEGAITTDEQARLMVQRRVGDKLVGFADSASPTEESFVGVATDSSRALYDSLDAFTWLPQLSITDRELAHTARREFIDFQHEVALQGVTN
jgi:hypothetical protein